MKRILALDQGTTSSRAIVFGPSAEVLGVGQREFTQHFPRPGWVEHDPEEIWETQLASLRAAVVAAGVGMDEIDAIGIANQRETAILWDRASGEPVAPAIVWQDRRTAGFCEAQRERWQEGVHAKTGLLIDPYFSGSKLRWMLDELPGVRVRAERGELAFGTVESWLVWKLTGGRVHVTDLSNASRTLMMDLRSRRWDEGLLAWLNVPRGVLPEIVGNSEVIAMTDAAVVGAELPIAGLAGDQQAALFGQLCVDEGMVKTTYGTGCFLLMNTGEEPVMSSNRLLTTVAWQIGGAPCQYALEGSVFTAGSAVQWLRDGLGLIGDAAGVNALAASVEDNGGVYLAPAFAGLGAPHWDPHARGVIAGLTRGSTAGHLARAVLEGIAFQVDDVVRAMRADTGLALGEVRVDGAASASDLLMQVQSDLLGCTITRSAVAETTAMGAAFFAGLAVGVWSEVDELRAIWRGAERFEPSGDAEKVKALRRGWQSVVQRSLGWASEVEG